MQEEDPKQKIDLTTGKPLEIPETHLGPRKGGSYTDMTFKDAQGRTVHVQTVDGGNYGINSKGQVQQGIGNMSQREANNAVRIAAQDPSAVIITVPKGTNLPAGSLNTSTMGTGVNQL